MKGKQPLYAQLGVMLGGFLATQCAFAANWFDVQTISLPEWGSGHFLSFIQPALTDYLDFQPVRGHVPKSDLVLPGYATDSNIQIQRARFFVRGGFNSNISYYVGAEAGQNQFAYSFQRYAPRVIDANVSFSNYIPGVRFEAGVIRVGGPEAAMQAFMDFTFFGAFENVIGQLMQPAFYKKNVMYSSAGNGGYSVPGADISGVNGFRYPGVQVYDWFRPSKNVELTYAAMYGEYGRQLESETYNGRIEAGRLQVSYLLGDGGGRYYRDDITAFVWAQHADPQLNGVANAMRRDGFGLTYRSKFMHPGGTNVKAEYIEGAGNIAVPAAFNSAPGLTAAQYDATFYPASSNTARGYYGTVGLFATRNVEYNLRYDYYDRLPNLPAQERIFKTLGAGFTYHFSQTKRVVLDYFHRNLDIPNPGAIPAAQRVFAQSVANQTGNAIFLYGIYTFGIP